MLTNFGVVESGIYRCAQPDAKGFNDLYHQLRVTTIIKLNDNSEYPLEREKQEFSGRVLDFGLSTFHPDIGVVRTIATNIDQLHLSLLSSRDALAIHCSHGRDRTGLVIGAWILLCCGWTMKRVEAE